MQIRNFIFLAEPFGFGPISSSIVVARQIQKINPEARLIFLGSGTSYQLATQAGVFDNVFLVDQLNEQSIAQCGTAIERANTLVIANTYPNGVEVAMRANLRCVYIDTLFWMWNKLPINISDVERYYIEDFHCAEINVDRFGHSVKYKKINPLIDVSAKSMPASSPSLIISLGGIDSNLYDFPVFYNELVANVSRDQGLDAYDVIICGGGKKFQKKEFAQFEKSNIKIRCLPPGDYVSHLKAADLVVAAAGLHGFYENLYLQKNVMFLPPQSYSQYLQLKFIAKWYPKLIGVNFENLGIQHKLRENMPDAERISEVKRTNQVLAEESVFMSFYSIFERFYRGDLKTDWGREKFSLSDGPNGALDLAEDLMFTARVRV